MEDSDLSGRNGRVSARVGGMLALGLAVAAFVQVLPAGRWENDTLHGALEGIGALATLVAAALLIALERHSGGEGFRVWLAAGLVAMGILGMAHAGLPGGPSYLPLHALSLLAGGFLFAMVWLPDRLTPKGGMRPVSSAVGGLALLIALGAAAIPPPAPQAVADPAFVLVRQAFILVGAAGFFAAAVKLFVMEGGGAGPFGLFAFLKGVGVLLIPLGSRWDGVWWTTHGLEVAAVLILLGHLVLAFREAGRRIRAIADELAGHVESRTKALRIEVEQRRLAERALLASEQRLRDMVEASTDWLWEMGPDLSFTHVSDSVRHSLGVEPSFLIGKTRSQVMSASADPARLQEFLAALAGHRPFRDFEFRFPHPDGTLRHLRLSGRPVFDGEGNFAGYRGSGTDVTQGVQQEAALREVERIRHAIVEATTDSVVMLAPDGICLAANSVAAQRLGWAVSDLLGKNILDLMPADVAETRRQRLLEAVSARRTSTHVDRRDGMWFEHMLHPVVGDEGEVTAVVIFSRDITDQRKAAERIEQLAAFPEQNPSPVMRVTGEGVLTYANRASGLLLEGWRGSVGKPVPENIRKVCETALRTGSRQEQEIAVGELAFSLLFVPVMAAGHVNVYGRDVTRFRLAQEALTQSEARAEEAWRRLRDSLESISEAFAMYDSGDRLILFNARFWDMWAGIEGCLSPGLTFAGLVAVAADRNVVVQAGGRRDGWVAALHDAHRKKGQAVEIRFANGRWWLLSDRPTEDGGTVTIGTDITVLKEREEELRRSEESLAAAQRIAGLGSWEWTLADGSLAWSRETFNIFRKNPETYRPTYTDFLESLHEEDRPRLIEAVNLALEEKGCLGMDFRVPVDDGPARIIHTQGQVLYDGEGRPSGMGGTVQDITDRKRREWEFLQAQKMEAIGQLTGGIAHDFNNILTVIRGNVELVHERLDGEMGGLLREILDDALSAVDQGAHLTSGLLAFARRETLRAEAVDVNAVATRMVALLRRTLHSFIAIETDLAEGLPRAHCDRRLLETAILNLALNARDAMPEGGTLTLATRAAGDSPADLPAGDYVAMSVSDTGVGIPEEMREKIFEPLFTTKKEGKGTGLGLRMVDIFARQSGGRVLLSSEAGKGTAFTLFLPVEEGDEGRDVAEDDATPFKGDGLALVADDDPGVRRFVRRCLEEMGFIALEARDAREALAVLEAEPGIRLLVSDIEMAEGKNGIDLAEEAGGLYPGLGIVLASGSAQARDEAARRLPGSVPVLAKPYAATTLTAAVRGLPAFVRP
jgi:PAS domain S-box-containing protein